jgi:N-acetylglutamate synthase-like GNAT family acetyltransferase
MRVRRAVEADIPKVIELARSLDLHYPGMERDRFWVAEDEGWIVGLVALKKHRDCQELCVLGVDPSERRKGTGRALVEALLGEATGDVHLATVIPKFFEALGFARTPDVPRSFIDKRKTEWCEGCDLRLCTVMVRKAS